MLARAIQGNDTSVVVSHRMLKIDHNWQLTLASPPDNQYSAGGSQALIDGLTGGAITAPANGKGSGVKIAWRPSTWAKWSESNALS